MDIRWSTEAASNLAEIHQYLFLDESPFTESTIATIYDAIKALPQMPFRGRPGRIKGTRELLFSKLPYIVVYRIEHDTVHILSIRHSARKPLD